MSLPLLIAGIQTVQEDILIWEYGLFDIYGLGRVSGNHEDILPIRPVIASLSVRMAEMATITYHFLPAVQYDDFWAKYGGNLWDRLTERDEAYLGLLVTHTEKRRSRVGASSKKSENLRFIP